MRLNIAVVDDDAAENARLIAFLRNWFGGSIHELGLIDSYSSGREIISAFTAGKYHIVLMDIIMGDVNGIEAAKFIRSNDSKVLIAFMTTSREYAFDAFPLHPFHYIVKPYWQKDIDALMNEAVNVLSAKEPVITLRLVDSECEIPLGSVSSAVSNGYTADIITADGRKIITAMSFTEAEELFADDPRFVLCKRGIIVNMSRVSAMKDRAFTMKEGQVYPISARRFGNVSHDFSQYLISRMREES